MKKLINKIKNKNIVKKLTYIAGAIILGVLLSSSNVFAASNTSSIDAFINFACDWLTKIGGIIALVGGVMFALGWQREDAEGKSRGLMTVMAGFMLVAIAQSKNLFGL
ncbi:MAG TPA: hypothetical protein OIM45_03615 [Clostridiaceae bacterium]|nr:hypothetical protein [Clostridiaceae bacterium]